MAALSRITPTRRNQTHLPPMPSHLPHHSTRLAAALCASCASLPEPLGCASTMADLTASNPLGSPRFATTHWSVVAEAAHAGTADGRKALEQLCRIYWRPLYTFARRRGLSAADAEDLTQAFFADLLKREAIACADASRGRFRTFLLSAFQNFQSAQRARASTIRRGGQQSFVSYEAITEAESHFAGEPSSSDSPETLFDRNWARSLLDEALAAVRLEYVAAGKAAVFDALKGALWGGRGEIPLAEVARRLESTEGAVKTAAHRLRRRCGERMREEIARTLSDPGDVEDELRFLLAALR